MASRIAEAYVQVVPRIDGIGNSLNKQLSTQLGSAGGEGGDALANGVGAGFGSKIGLALQVGFAAATVAIGAFV